MSDATESTAPTDAEPAQDQPKPEAPEIDWKAKAREWEKRAKENKSAADRLAELEEANKTEAQKTAERLAAAEKAAADALADASRFKIAAKFNISDEDAELFLTGADEETLTRQAERLAERESTKRRAANFAPKVGENPRPAVDDERAAVRALFGSGT
jgi:predicted ATP-dependent protease